MQIEFELGEPFQPFNQLMGVLPAGSKHALPEPLRPLFDTEESPILDFYPSEFKIDMNGKRFAWQGVALLPFIEEDRLLDATGPIIGELPPDERRRNEKCAPLGWRCVSAAAMAPCLRGCRFCRRLSMILARADSAAGSTILEQATKVKSEKVSDDKLSEHAVALPTEKTLVSGQLVPCRGDACPPTVSVPPFARSIGKPIENNRVRPDLPVLLDASLRASSTLCSRASSWGRSALLGPASPCGDTSIFTPPRRGNFSTAGPPQLI